MYVCEKCHDTDIDATQCGYTYAIHDHMISEEPGECEICGKQKLVIFCDEYQAEIISRLMVKRGGLLKNEYSDLGDLR